MLQSAIANAQMMAADWHEGERAVQTRAGVTDHRKLRNGVRDALPPHFEAFLLAQRFVVLATRDTNGLVWCSMVAGWPGFASAVHPQLVSIDRRAFTDEDVLDHLAADPRVGLLAFDPSTRRRIRVNGIVSIGAKEVALQLVETFGNCQQYIQKRPAAGPAPAEVARVSSGDLLQPLQREWIARADTCFLATIHDRDGLDASHRGGRAGFVTVLDNRTLSFHDYRGNDMFQSLGNLTANPTAAMLFVDFDTGATLQLSGEAVVEWNVEGSPTGRAVRFTARQVVEKRPRVAWAWPVLEYSPVNP
jgi:predicted pyridoxine 5'-phosphate oxidase superfamily flavin-nucleotide-binding protein